MSHHFGESAVTARVTASGFKIEIRNHETNAVITISGPIEGVFETPGKRMTQRDAEYVGHELAHHFRTLLR